MFVCVCVFVPLCHEFHLFVFPMNRTERCYHFGFIDLQWTLSDLDLLFHGYHGYTFMILYIGALCVSQVFVKYLHNRKCPNNRPIIMVAIPLQIYVQMKVLLRRRRRRHDNAIKL